MTTTRPRLPEIAISAVGVLLVGCGANMRNVVESDMRFEHCYRLDEDPTTPVDQKRGCWREWTARYTRGQDRSRVRYARDRLAVLDGATSVSLDTGEASWEAPPPASPYVVPPSVAPKASARTEAIAPRQSLEFCTGACTRSWKTCSQDCTGADACGGACEDRYKTCLKGCL